MNARWLSVLAMSGMGVIVSTASAQVTGTVKLDGKAPQMHVIDMSTKPECSALHKGQTILEETVVVDAKNHLKNVVVSIATPDSGPLPAVKHSEPAILTQKGCMYIPHVLAMQVGQPLVVCSDDPFVHNIQSFSKNMPFNIQQQNVDTKGQKVGVPKDAEYFDVKCQVHAWMIAHIAVLDNGYFAVTKDDGTFEIAIPKGFPDGDYTISAWQEKYGKQDGTVTIKDGKGTVEFTFSADSGANAAPSHVADKAQVASAGEKK